MDTTSINDLPTDPASGGSIGGNINLITTEKPTTSINESVNINSNNISLDQNTINQIVNGLQYASSTGATILPSRDIPRNTLSMTQDPNIQPNYISPDNNKYIDDNISNEEIEDNYHSLVNKNNSLDSLYDELQIPLLLIVLYFTFQLPIFKTTLFKYLPLLCNTDGNMNLNGLLFTSVSFGIIYYILSQIILKFSKF
jgi:hypothetical protein